MAQTVVLPVAALRRGRRGRGVLAAHGRRRGAELGRAHRSVRGPLGLHVRRARLDGRRLAREPRLPAQAVSSTVTVTLVPNPPMLWARPQAASTCRPSALPASCRYTSATCARPVADSGWPRALSPPDGFTG